MAPRAREYQPGDRVPGTVYQVGRVIGSGGMGTVYDVEDTTIGKRYVLKTLHSELGSREDLARRMQNEARQLARLNHTNIVEVITAGVTGDDMRLPYYVMERLNGQSLRLVLEKKGQLELPHAYHIAIDLLDALDHAHDKGVIHRDVKPDNIFLHRTSAGVTVTKLLDFGILSLLDSTHRETAGRFLGTLRYAAPEQLRGEKPSPKVDVYAAALVLFEMVAGRGPFDDEGDPQNVGAAHIHKVAPPLSHFVVVPRELDALVSAALSKLPAQRPRDAFSFAASLRNLKKALAGAPAQESTENRATAAAVLGPESQVVSPIVHVAQAMPNGPYVISPTPVVQREPLEAAPPFTTMRGMIAPSMVPSLAQPLAQPMGYGPTATSPQSVDRNAPTNSLAPAPGLPPSQQLTGSAVALRPAFSVPPAPPTLQSGAPPALAANAQPFRWPPERPAARSEEPQVRTLSAAGAGPARSMVPVVMAAVFMFALGVVSVGMVVMRLRGPSASAAAASPSAHGATVTAVPVPPAPQPVVAMPAPTLAPPALEEPSWSGASAAAAPTLSAAAAASARAPAPTTATALPKATVPAYKPPAAPVGAGRPGPGF